MYRLVYAGSAAVDTWMPWVDAQEAADAFDHDYASAKRRKCAMASARCIGAAVHRSTQHIFPAPTDARHRGKVLIRDVYHCSYHDHCNNGLEAYACTKTCEMARQKAVGPGSLPPTGRGMSPDELLVWLPVETSCYPGHPLPECPWCGARLRPRGW